MLSGRPATRRVADVQTGFVLYFNEERGPVRAIRTRVWPRDVQTGEAPRELLRAAGCADRLLSRPPPFNCLELASNGFRTVLAKRLGRRGDLGAVGPTRAMA